MPKSIVISVKVAGEPSPEDYLELLNQASMLWSRLSLTEWARREQLSGRGSTGSAAKVIRTMKLYVEEPDWDATFKGTVH